MRTEPLPDLRKGAPRPHPTEAAHAADPWSALVCELKPPLTPAQAKAEAYRCLLCGGPYAPAPCTVACPAEVDVPGFIDALAMDDPTRAAAIILEANPLGATCARVCPTEVLCEGACVLHHEGQRPVDIGRLQRFALDEGGLGAGAAPAQTATGRKVAVVGAGPAGLACASVLASLGHSVTVYDERREVGGLVRYAIAPYRQLNDPLPEEMARLEAMGVRFVLGMALDGREAFEALRQEFDALFLGVGLGEDMEAGVEGADLVGVWSSLPFIEAIKTGHLPEVGERVIVVGGGNTAMDVAREAVRLGAREVTVLYRRTEAEMPAYPHEVAEAREEGVRFMWLTVPVRFLGEHRLTAVECRHMRLGDPDASGRRRPEPVPGTEFVLPADTVIQAVGQRPRSQLAEWIPGLAFDHGRLVVDPETGRTGSPKVYAGGDAVNGGDTVVMAVRLGKIAAQTIHRDLMGEEGR